MNGQRQTDGQTNKQTRRMEEHAVGQMDRQMDEWTNRQIDRQTNKHTFICMDRLTKKRLMDEQMDQFDRCTDEQTGKLVRQES